MGGGGGGGGIRSPLGHLRLILNFNRHGLPVVNVAELAWARLNSHTNFKVDFCGESVCGYGTVSIGKWVKWQGEGF